MKIHTNKASRVITIEDTSVKDLSAFALKVYKEIKKVAKCKIMTYKELAQKCGKPNAIRAVATIVGNNKNPIIIPCHRIIRSDNTVGEYTYKGKRNQAKKVSLLRSEGIIIRKNKVIKLN